MAKKKTNDELSPAFKISSAMQKTGARLLRFSKIMVSISGGADSDVMLDLLLKVCPKEKMTFVFFDTGIEYDATKRHLDYLEKKYDIKIDRQRADVPVPLGVKKYGLPFISKMISGSCIGRRLQYLVRVMNIRASIANLRKANAAKSVSVGNKVFLNI